MTAEIKIVKFMAVVKVNREWIEDAGDMPDLFTLLKEPRPDVGSD